MQVLLRRQLQWDIEIAVVRADGDLFATPYLTDPDPSLQPLREGILIVWTSPVVVAGRLPAGAVAVRARAEDAWSSVQSGDGAWLAVASHKTHANPFDELEYVDANGNTSPVPSPAGDVLAAMAREHAIAAGTSEPPGRDPPSAEARAYGAALAQAIADDLARNPASGELRRAVVRWFWEGDPMYLSIHVLGAGDEQPEDEDAWYPLEWTNQDREFRRTDRVLARPEVVAAAVAFAATFERDDDGYPVDGEAHVPGVLEAVRGLSGALRSRGIALGPRFAAAAAHFEGWGLLSSLEATAPREVFDALREHGELPDD